jgi:hypothetical protein
MLGAGQGTRPLPTDVRARVGAKVGASLTVPAAASAMLTWKASAIAAGLGVMSVIAAPYLAPSSAQGPAAVPRVSIAAAEAVRGPATPTSRAESFTEPTPEPIAVPEPPRPSPPKAARRQAMVSSPGGPAPSPSVAASPLVVEDTLAREVALLERARAHFDGEPASTLAILDEHAHLFPNGKLAMERELLALDALERLGRKTEARARAARLVAVARGSLYETRIQGHLE